MDRGLVANLFARLEDFLDIAHVRLPVGRPY